MIATETESRLLTFTDAGAGVHVDLEKLVAGRMLIQATSGGGKSWMLRYLLEQTHGKIQQFVIDPEGEFATLREKFDYVLVGRVERGESGERVPGSADIQADPRTARQLARRLVELGVYAVIDLSELKVDKRREFVQAFLDGLMYLPRELWRPLLVVIDEADLFAPEGKRADEATALAAMVDLASRGRKRGYSLIAATQRLAKLNKDVAGMLTNKLIGRTTLDIDLSRAAGDLGMFKADWQTLKNLRDGRFFAAGPAFDAQVALVHSADKLQSTHPRPGTIAPPIAGPSANIGKLLAGLDDLPEFAEREINDLAEAKREIARLMQTIRTGKSVAAVVPEPEIQRRITAAVEAAVAPYRTRESEITDALDTLSEAFVTQLRQMVMTLRHGVPPLTVVEGKKPAWDIPTAAPSNGHKPPEPEIKPPPAEPRPVKERTPHVEDGSITKPQQRILDTLATFESIGVTAVDRDTLALFVGIAPTTKSHTYALSDLLKADRLRIPRAGTVGLSESGKEFAAPVSGVPTLKELHYRWVQSLRGKHKMAEILEAMLPRRDPISREEIAGNLGLAMTTKSLTYGFSGLISLGVLRPASSGFVQLTELLFPEGLK